MTLPTPDAQSPKSLPLYPRPASATHSNPHGFSLPSTPPLPSTSTPYPEADLISGERSSASTDFSQFWDLATGGLKTLTAKRELPPRQTRVQAALPSAPPSAPSYMFLLVILACIVVMLISGGVVLFMTLQP